MWSGISLWLDLHFYNDWWCWASFHGLFGHWIFFGEMSIQILCPLFLFFSFSKIGPELTSVPGFLYFMWDTATAWLDEWCEVCAQDPDPWTLGSWSGACELNCSTTKPAPCLTLWMWVFLEHCGWCSVLIWASSNVCFSPLLIPL